MPSLTLACLSVTVGLWWVTHYYSGRLRPAYLRNRELYDSLVLLFTESVRGMQTVKGFAAEPHQIRRFEEANRHVSDQQKRIFRDLSMFTPADAGAVAIEPGDPVRLWRVALCAGADSAGQRAGGVRGPDAAVQRAGGQHHHHRQLGAAELHGRPARVRGARHARRRCRTGPAPSCRRG